MVIFKMLIVKNMFRVFLSILVIIFLGCASGKVSPVSNTYYIVRHAEKDTVATNMTSDVSLSVDGEARAIALRDALRNNSIGYVFSTNTIRARSTAKPLVDAIGVTIQIYNSVDSAFINSLRRINNKNVLVVGHSNTVDDIVNGLTGTNHLQDLKDTEYGDLFIVEKKDGTYTFRRSTFGNK